MKAEGDELERGRRPAGGERGTRKSNGGYEQSTSYEHILMKPIVLYI
jgi:hypothetical protein